MHREKKHTDPGIRAAHGAFLSSVALGKSLDSFEPLQLNDSDDDYQRKSMNGLINSMITTELILH